MAEIGFKMEVKAGDPIKAMHAVIAQAAKEGALVSTEETQAILREASKTITTDSINKLETFQRLDKIVAQMEKWLQEHRVRQAIFEKRRELNYKLAARRGMDTSDRGGLRRFFNSIANKFGEKKEARANREYLKEEQNLIQSFLRGYRLWEAFRMYSTGQEITYAVLYRRGKQLYEARISLDEFFSRINNKKGEGADIVLTINKDGSLRYQIEFTDLTATDEQLEAEEFQGTPFYNQFKSRYASYAKHLGSIYETYEQIRSFQDFPVWRGVTDYWYDCMNSWIRSNLLDNDMDTASGRTVGDQALTQNKNITKNGAKLSAIQTLPNDISNLITAYKSKNVDELLRLLTADESKGNIHLSSVTSELNKEARNEILKTFK